MTKYLTILCVVAIAGGVRADDVINRTRNTKSQAQTTAAKPAVSSVHAFHPGATGHSTGVQTFGTQRFQKTQLNTTNTVNTARFRNTNHVSTAKTLNTTNTGGGTARFRTLDNTNGVKATTNNTGRFQRFNTTNVHNNVTVNNNTRFRQFNLANAHPNAPRITFRAGNHIVGASNWSGSQYSVFRNYSAQWHDSSWWRARHSRLVFVLGGWYYWDNNFWLPAYGYDPGASYYWDGPIYAANDLPPDQVVANVQASLQEQGYYHGAIDGAMGPLTRAAIASYQQDHGLLVTSAIDQPTAEALGV